MNERMSLYKDLDYVLLTEDEIKAGVKKLGEQLTQDYVGRKPLFVCILRGSIVFFADLIRQVDLPLDIDCMAVSSYGSGTETSGMIKMEKDLREDVKGRDVIIVEDIVDTGRTLFYLKADLEKRGVSSVRLVTLLDKPSRRQTEIEADYACFTIPDAFVVGYGLDFNEKYRNLPDIGVLHPRIYSK